MTRRTTFLGTILVLVAATALGYRSGLDNQGAGPVSESDMASPTPTTQSDAPKDVGARTASRPIALPDDPLTLGGAEFLVALPELERRAHGGNMTALLAIYRQFTACVGYEPRTDSEIRKHADESYERFKDIERDALARNPDWKLPPDIPTPEESREHALDSAFGRRTVCAALTPADLEQRFDWARLALEQHDRRMVIDLGGAGHLQVDTPELVRNAERLIELQELERLELDRLVAMGDMDAIARAAIGASSDLPSLTPYDPVRAWTLAKVWVLANPGTDQWGMQRRMARLEQESLTPAQLEQARAQADELHARCCASARGVGN
jgi:hypothetical protein